MKMIDTQLFSLRVGDGDVGKKVNNSNDLRESAERLES